jgi:BirA family biotin operon repressor/biotin-[acetyl-CoA-carboxylase] ligase
MLTSSRLKRLHAKLPARRLFARNIEIVEQCQSTNDELKERIAAGENVSNTLLVANDQQSGRGRSARDWWSGDAGDNLCFSLGLRNENMAPHIVGLVGAVALADVCQQLLPNERLAIKWPNDILLNGSKLAGFLCELPAGGDTLILGLGVNVNTKPPSDEVPYSVACLNEHNLNITPLELLALVMHRFESLIVRYQRHSSSDFEDGFLNYLRLWAPNGVRNPTNQKAGALLKFSVANGLTLDVDGEHFTQAMEAINCLEKINNVT